MKYTALPTWFIAGLMFRQPFRAYVRLDHPWLKWSRWPTLNEWAQHRTDITKQFDLVFWVSGVCMVTVAVRTFILFNS